MFITQVNHTLHFHIFYYIFLISRFHICFPINFQLPPIFLKLSLIHHLIYFCYSNLRNITFVSPLNLLYRFIPLSVISPVQNFICYIWSQNFICYLRSHNFICYARGPIPLSVTSDSLFEDVIPDSLFVDVMVPCPLSVICRSHSSILLYWSHTLSVIRSHTFILFGQVISKLFS